MLIKDVLSSDIQKAFANSFRGIEELVDGQIKKIKEKSLSVTVRILGIIFISERKVIRVLIRRESYLLEVLAQAPTFTNISARSTREGKSMCSNLLV